MATDDVQVVARKSSYEPIMIGLQANQPTPAYAVTVYNHLDAHHHLNSPWKDMRC